MIKSFGSGMCLCIILFLISCGKETANPDLENPADYFDLTTGKTIVYQLDSIVKTPFNDTAFRTISYQAKDVIDIELTDNLGRPGWRVYRFLRPANSTSEQDWVPNMTYMITPLSNAVEVIEHNLRFQKLVFPINETTFWRGNTHINTTPGGPLDYLDAWQYHYENIGSSFTLPETTIDQTITVVQADESLGVIDEKPENPDLGAYRTYSIEVYAKGIGLIYKEFRYWNYKSRTVDVNGNPVAPLPYGETEGEGIRLQMIDRY